SRTQQSRKPDLRLLRFSADEFDQEYPFVAVVEEKSQLRPNQRESLADARPLDASCLTLALSHIDKQLVADGSIINVSLQFAVEPKRVVEVEIEEADNRVREGIQAACTCDLEVPTDFRAERRAKNEGLCLSHSA